jgi:hypothetical protein
MSGAMYEGLLDAIAAAPSLEQGLCVPAKLFDPPPGSPDRLPCRLPSPPEVSTPGGSHDHS